MKANHVPTKDRLIKKIDTLKIKLDQTVPIGGGNPYYMCKHCCESEPQISISGHRPGCPNPGWKKEKLHYEKLLADLNIENLV